MTDLESKIKSEFATGDPTESDIDVTKEQPVAMRFSLRRVISVVAILLLITGGVITYYAGTVNAPMPEDSPVTATSESEVKSDTTQETDNNETTLSSPGTDSKGKTASRTQRQVLSSTTQPTDTPVRVIPKPEQDSTPDPDTDPTPTNPDSTPSPNPSTPLVDLSAVTGLLGGVTKLVTGTVSILL